MSRWLLTVPMTLLALSAGAEPTTADCEVRAAQPLDPPVAASAVIAPAAAPTAAPTDAQADEQTDEQVDEQAAPASRLDRFVAGLFSMEPQRVKTRPGGKYRYIEKE